MPDFIVIYSTCEELSIEHVDSLIFPGILTVQVNSVQKVFNKCRQHHGQQDCILKDKKKRHFVIFMSKLGHDSLS